VVLIYFLPYSFVAHHIVALTVVNVKLQQWFGLLWHRDNINSCKISLTTSKVEIEYIHIQLSDKLQYFVRYIVTHVSA